MEATTATTQKTEETPAGRVELVDLGERMFWTFVAAFASALVSPPVAQAAGLDVSLSALEAGVLAGTSAVLNFVSVVARWRLAVLPDPGAGLRRRRPPQGDESMSTLPADVERLPRAWAEPVGARRRRCSIS